MALQDLQKEVDQWVSEFTPSYWKPHEIMVRLMEETGELSREINHRFGPKPKKASEDPMELGDEIADIMFTLVCLANSQRIDLDDAWQKMMDKVTKRDAERFQKK